MFIGFFYFFILLSQVRKHDDCYCQFVSHIQIKHLENFLDSLFRDWTNRTCPKMRIDCWYFYCFFIVQLFSISYSLRTKKIPRNFRCKQKKGKFYLVGRNTDGNVECVTKNNNNCFYTKSEEVCKNTKKTQQRICSVDPQIKTRCKLNVEAGTVWSHKKIAKF